MKRGKLVPLGVIVALLLLFAAALWISADKAILGAP